MGRKRIIALGGGIIALVVAAGIILRSECREKMSKELFSFRRLYIYIYIDIFMMNRVRNILFSLIKIKLCKTNTAKL